MEKDETSTVQGRRDEKYAGCVKAGDMKCVPTVPGPLSDPVIWPWTDTRWT